MAYTMDGKNLACWGKLKSNRDNVVVWITRSLFQVLNWMGHSSFWFTLTTLIYGSKTSIQIKKKTEALLVNSNETGLEVYAENTQYAPVSWTEYKTK